MQTLLVEARAEAAKIRAQASAREATLLRALDEAHAENQLLKDASISAPREPYAGQRLFDESAAKRLIDTYGSRGGGDGGTAVGLLPLPADSPQAPVRGLRPGLLPLPPDSPLSGPHEHDGYGCVPSSCLHWHSRASTADGKRRPCPYHPSPYVSI
jgi:hypothetical protein